MGEPLSVSMGIMRNRNSRSKRKERLGKRRGVNREGVEKKMKEGGII